MTWFINFVRAIHTRVIPANTYIDGVRFHKHLAPFFGLWSNLFPEFGSNLSSCRGMRHSTLEKTIFITLFGFDSSTGLPTHR